MHLSESIPFPNKHRGKDGKGQRGEKYPRKNTAVPLLQFFPVVDRVANFSSRSADLLLSPRRLLVAFLNIYWVALGLSYGTQDLSLCHAGFSGCDHGLSCFTACEILVPQLKVEPICPTQGRSLTTAAPGKSLSSLIKLSFLVKFVSMPARAMEMLDSCVNCTC